MIVTFTNRVGAASEALIPDALRGGQRFIVHADEKLTTFVELERQVLTVTFYLYSGTRACVEFAWCCPSLVSVTAALRAGVELPRVQPIPTQNLVAGGARSQ